MVRTPAVTSRISFTSRARRALRDFLAVQVELHERAALQDRPWEEEFLHWAADGDLHGRLVPPAGHGHSTTRGGWCPGLARTVPAASPRTGSSSPA